MNTLEAPAIAPKAEPRTRPEIEHEIELLHGEHLAASRDRHLNAARHAIQAQIDILDILLAARPGVVSEDDVEGVIRGSDFSLSCAKDAFRWAAGASEDKPSEEWTALL